VFDGLLKFFRTPKGLLIIVFAVLLALTVPFEGARLVAPGLAAAMLTAALVDVPILRWRSRRWQFPSGALLTGLIVAMILSPHESWKVAAMTTAIGVLSKYVARTRTANVFNPAALALVAAFYLFSTEQSWWGALPDLPLYALAALFATGVFITDRVNKLPLVLVFLAGYFLLFTAAAFVASPARVAEVFRTPDLHAVLFFAFFILTDPPTSPVKYRDQITCGVIVAVVSFAVFETTGVVYYLLAGVLVGNVWEAWRRSRLLARRQPRPAGSAAGTASVPLSIDPGRG